MALTEKHRSSIYRSLAPILGEEEAEAMLSQFPRHDADQPVTRHHLGVTVGELREEMGGLRTEMAEQFAEVDRRFAEVDRRFAEVDRRFADVDVRLADLRTEIADSSRRTIMWLVGAIAVLFTAQTAALGVMVSLAA